MRGGWHAARVKAEAPVWGSSTMHAARLRQWHASAGAVQSGKMRPVSRLDRAGRGAGLCAGGKIGACLRFNFTEALGYLPPLVFLQVDDVCRMSDLGCYVGHGN